jgi:hypothetical protein
MAEVSQKTKYVKLDDGVSFALVRTNPKLTTNTKLMYNGKKMYMESYASSPLLNRNQYKNVSVRQNSTFNKDIANFLTGSGPQAYAVYQNFSDIAISDSYDNQFETMYWCGAECIDSYFYDEEIGFVAPLYLREKLPNYFLIFRLDTPSNYNLNVDENGNVLDSTFDFKTDILDKAVLIKTFDLREGSVLGNYIHNYVEQESFEFDKSMYVNFSTSEVTYYGINKFNGVLEKKVESFGNELLKNDNPVLKNDQWFTEGFERNNLIFPYIMNIEYLFNDDTFKHKDGESYDFARYIGVYCNNIEFGEFSDLSEFGETEDNAIYYFEDKKNNLHRYIKKIKTNDGGGSDSYDSDNVNDATEYEVTIDGKDIELFDKSLISGFEKERITAYAEPLDIYEGFINRAQYGFEIFKAFEPGDWIGIEFNGKVECYFADNIDCDIDGFRFSVSENSTISDVAKTLVKCINRNKKSEFEARYLDNVVVIYAKKEGKKYNDAKILLEESLIHNKKISLPLFNNIQHYDMSDSSDSDGIVLIPDNEELLGDYYMDCFYGACNVYIDSKTETYKNVFKIYVDEYVFFAVDRYLKTNNGDGRRICSNIQYIDVEGDINAEYRIVIVDDIPKDKDGDAGYEVSVSSTYQVEIMDIFKPNHGVLSWFPVKDFDFDINYSSYGQYSAFVDECNRLSKKVTYKQNQHVNKNKATNSDYNKSMFEDYVIKIKELAKSPLFDEYGSPLYTEYDYYLEQLHPELCLLSKSVPYISKWGYFDEQKDSCENPYRLNVNKVFGVSNLSANTYLSSCNEDEYTHSMPYYMTLDSQNYYKNYQYVITDDIYNSYSSNKSEKYVMSLEDEYDSDLNTLNTFFDCVDYWINVFMRTDEDMFSYFFSGKKYGNRFDRKYSRLLDGNKFHNPSTLFRGVKFEAVRQYNGIEKRSAEYNDYKFSFVYIPVMVDSMIFSSTIHFVKNDTFKFIVGIIFVNTMLGTYKHNIFNYGTDYFNKGFLYAACKDIIRPENDEKNKYNLTIRFENSEESDSDINENELKVNEKYNVVWENNVDVDYEDDKFYMWIDKYKQSIVVTKTKNVSKIKNIIGEFSISSDSYSSIDKDIEGIKPIEPNYYTSIDSSEIKNNKFDIYWNRYYEEYDTTIYGVKKFEYFGYILCEIIMPDIKFVNNTFVDVCDNDWSYYNEYASKGYKVDVSKLYFKSVSIKNILVNLGTEDSVVSIKFYNTDVDGNLIPHGEFKNIKVDLKNGDVEILGGGYLKSEGYYGETIENLRMDIIIKDRLKQFSESFDSLAFKDYFSVFNQISMYNITESINRDYNVKYYSTVEDNKYKIRVIEPDSIEIEDKYEFVPLKITQNNRRVVGSVAIKEKMNTDKIGIKVINRYSGYYNPIFNDILYYGDYTYTKTIGRLEDKVKYELPYSNTYIDYGYDDGYGSFGVIRNMYYHKTNTSRSDSILTSMKPIYPAINEYALDYRDYNIFSSSWDDGYFISQDNLDERSVCAGIGSMKDSLCMFGSKYLNLPDYIFIDTFENGELWNEKQVTGIGDISDSEIIYKEINGKTVRYYLFAEKRLKRYLKESLMDVFSKYINKEYSFGNKGTIEDDIYEYVEKNLLKLYKLDKVHMYVKGETMRVHDKKIDNEYLKYMNISNENKIKNGFPVIKVENGVMLKDSKFVISKTNEFDRIITYNLKPGFKESFGFGVSFKRK